MAIISTEPRVSTAGIDLIIVLCSRAILLTPKARITEVVAGNPSGIAPTNIATTAKASAGKAYIFNMNPITKMMIDAIIEIYDTTLPTPSISLINGVLVDFICETSREILPISVSLAVATTIPRPLPVVTAVEAYAILVRSANGIFSSLRVASLLVTELVSPVKADSSILKLSASTILKSAGTLSPASKNTTSPLTKSAAAISLRIPSR